MDLLNQAANEFADNLRELDALIKELKGGGEVLEPWRDEDEFMVLSNEDEDDEEDSPCVEDAYEEYEAEEYLKTI